MQPTMGPQFVKEANATLEVNEFVLNVTEDVPEDEHSEPVELLP